MFDFKLTTENEAANEFSKNISDNLESINSNLKKASETAKKFYDKKRKEISYKENDFVYLNSKNICLKIPSQKFGPKFVGPFKITEIINPVAYRLGLPSN